MGWAADAVPAPDERPDHPAEESQEHPVSGFRVLKLVGRYEHGAFVPGRAGDEG